MTLLTNYTAKIQWLRCFDKKISFSSHLNIAFHSTDYDSMPEYKLVITWAQNTEWSEILINFKISQNFAPFTLLITKHWLSELFRLIRSLHSLQFYPLYIIHITKHWCECLQIIFFIIFFTIQILHITCIHMKLMFTR